MQVYGTCIVFFQLECQVHDSVQEGELSFKEKDETFGIYLSCDCCVQDK